MASRVALSSGGDDVLKGMSSKLAVILSTQGKKEREAWEELHDKLADVATSIADQTNTIEDILRKLEREMGSLVLGYPEAEVLIRRIMGLVEEKVRAESAHASKAISLLKTLILLLADELNMIPLRNSAHLDMIDKYSTFSEKNVDDMVKNSLELSAPNAPYKVVSIVGAQISGKSYLLNHLFRTKFPVMDPAFGRRQTTRGILMSRCIEPSMLVLDIEGFDGRERGLDTLFEKQAALFALAVSDLMMVNISLYEIGREQGGGRSLFETIFQERTKLPPGLTNIVVVLRYYDGETPLETLTKDIIENLEEIWRSVNKECKPLRNYIEINVVGLHDKESECFQEEVTTLRKLLSNITDSARVPASSFSLSSARVPASSFSLSSKMLWDQIKQNKKLDLRSHMMLLATLHCQQTLEACIAQFDYELLKSQESPRGFKEVSNTLLSNIITQYNLATDMYDAGVRDNERQNLVEKINKIIKEHSRELLRKIQEGSSAEFQDESARELEILENNDDVVNYDEHKVESCVEKFINSCEDLKLFDPENFHNSCEELRKQLTIYLAFHILSLKEVKLGQMTQERQRMEEDARKTAEIQQISDKKIEQLTMKLDHEIHERQRLEESARKAVEVQQKAEKNIELWTMQLDKMTQEGHRLGEDVRKAAEKEQIFNKNKEELTMNLEQMTQERRRLEEDTRKTAEIQQISNQKIEELMMKLDQMTQERQHLEEDARKAAEKEQMITKNKEELTMNLEQMTQERRRLAEDAGKTAEIQQMSDKKIEELMMKLDQMTQERQRLEESVRKAIEEQKKSEKNLELLTMKLDQMTREGQRLEDARKEAEKQQMCDMNKEELPMKLVQMTQERGHLEESLRKAVEEQEKANKNIELLTMKLDQRTQERQRREVDIQLEKERQQQKNSKCGN